MSTAVLFGKDELLLLEIFEREYNLHLPFLVGSRNDLRRMTCLDCSNDRAAIASLAWSACALVSSNINHHLRDRYCELSQKYIEIATRERYSQIAIRGLFALGLVNRLRNFSGEYYFDMAEKGFVAFVEECTGSNTPFQLDFDTVTVANTVRLWKFEDSTNISDTCDVVFPSTTSWMCMSKLQQLAAYCISSFVSWQQYFLLQSNGVPSPVDHVSALQSDLTYLAMLQAESQDCFIYVHLQISIALHYYLLNERAAALSVFVLVAERIASDPFLLYSCITWKWTRLVAAILYQQTIIMERDVQKQGLQRDLAGGDTGGTGEGGGSGAYTALAHVKKRYERLCKQLCLILCVHWRFSSATRLATAARAPSSSTSTPFAAAVVVELDKLTIQDLIDFVPDKIACSPVSDDALSTKLACLSAFADKLRAGLKSGHMSPVIGPPPLPTLLLSRLSQTQTQTQSQLSSLLSLPITPAKPMVESNDSRVLTAAAPITLASVTDNKMLLESLSLDELAELLSLESPEIYQLPHNHYNTNSSFSSHLSASSISSISSSSLATSLPSPTSTEGRREHRVVHVPSSSVLQIHNHWRINNQFRSQEIKPHSE